MAPALGTPWGSEVTGSEVGGWTAPASRELALVGPLAVLSAFLLLTLLLLLCAGCQGQKKANQLPGDHENLMNGVSEKETCSQSAETGSHGTDLVASSSHNGPLTSGTVLTDAMDTSPHPSEEMLSSLSELRSSKCPQDRELPSIPASSTLQGSVVPTNGPGASGDGTYEVLKDGTSRDASVEDSLYETVKELKGLAPPSAAEDPADLANDLPSHAPATPEHHALPNGAEYASVNLKKKSRYSAEVEARRSAASMPPEEPEEEKPPPIPHKVLDKTESQQINGLHNGQSHSLLSSPQDPEDFVSSDHELSAVYSTVDKPVAEEKEHDYSCIADITGLGSESTSSDLYATVRDVCPSPPGEQPLEEAVESVDPGYETIRIPKAPEEEQQANGQAEPDYETVGELGLNRETSRL
ncbi:phosphoprotein associated with glycosphingolipid-enriched microdomains 1 [Electrophorus electricus]|uniref:Phosphoprotein membrane anchor with glycosphingolipid microdomains 1 n=1 Tax=Electrophorus electricus TaxID=8005 RepID=A0AAY5EL68_ELEEL|nr:phosphoprotein associated with glycosphingolipid-enriched microdomains 1 [Electrophorus electricus]